MVYAKLVFFTATFGQALQESGLLAQVVQYFLPLLRGSGLPMRPVFGLLVLVPGELTEDGFIKAEPG